MKKTPEGSYRRGKSVPADNRQELCEVKVSASPDTIRNETFQNIVALLPDVFYAYRIGKNKPHHRLFLEKVKIYRFKPAIQLMLAMDMREGEESYLKIMNQYIDQIYTQSEIESEDIGFIKEIFRYARQKQNYQAIGPDEIDPKYGTMTVGQLIDEIFRYRNVTHLKSELISALWHAVNRGI